MGGNASCCREQKTDIGVYDDPAVQQEIDAPNIMSGATNMKVVAEQSALGTIQESAEPEPEDGTSLLAQEKEVDEDPPYTGVQVNAESTEQSEKERRPSIQRKATGFVTKKQ